MDIENVGPSGFVLEFTSLGYLEPREAPRIDELAA
uniref:Uncharacterized protein n=1 Tax=Candidatus Kentrum sp. DK TaxID=2126562 RepID=A0A450S8Z6_9GAMM|nr:MAG: hypothetical protein BECKDK2373B_GA0170837_102049 [Candidatus Kentron sp. DK]